MRPGPPVEALSGGYGVGARVSVRRGGEVLAVDVPAEDVVYEYTAGRAVPSRVTYTAPYEWVPDHPLSPLNNYGQRSHLTALVEVGGSIVEVGLGEYVHTDWEETPSGVRVTALDLMQVTAENPAVFPSSPPEGATLESELSRICAPLPVVLDCADSPVERSLQYGVDQVANLHDLCAARGLIAAVRADGCLHVVEKRSSREPDAVYTGRDLLVEASRKSQPRRANRWVVVGDEKSGVHATARLDSSPYDPGGYGLVTERAELSSATTVDEVQARADELMRRSSESLRQRSFQIALDPRLEGGDVIGVVTGERESVVGRVYAIVAPLDDPSGVMRVDVEVMEW